MNLLSISYILFSFILVNPFSVKREMKCQVNKKFCLNNICRLRILGQRFSVVDFHCSVPLVINKIEIVYKIMRKHPDGSSADIINVREDACKLIKDSGNIPIISRILPELKKYGLSVKGCPLKGNVTIKNCPANLSMFSSIIPPGNYRTLLNFTDMERHEHILTIATQITITA